MKNYFNFIEFSENHWVIMPKHDLFGEHRITGSFALLASRFSGLSWPDWIKYCVQNGAKLQGKNSIYVSIYWDAPNNKFLNELNKRINEIAKVINIKELNY